MVDNLLIETELEQIVESGEFPRDVRIENGAFVSEYEDGTVIVNPQPQTQDDGSVAPEMAKESGQEQPAEIPKQQPARIPFKVHLKRFAAKCWRGWMFVTSPVRFAWFQWRVSRVTIDPNAKCPSCGARNGKIVFDPMYNAVRHHCNVDHAEWHERCIVKPTWVIKSPMPESLPRGVPPSMAHMAQVFGAPVQQASPQGQEVKK